MNAEHGREMVKSSLSLAVPSSDYVNMEKGIVLHSASDCYLASLVPRLPVFDCFQYEIRRGKAWEIWSCVVPSGRQVLNTQGAVPNEESQCPFLYCTSVQRLSEHSQGRRSIPRNRYYNGWTPPPPPPPPKCLLSLRDVIACDQSSLAFPHRISHWK